MMQAVTTNSTPSDRDRYIDAATAAMRIIAPKVDDSSIQDALSRAAMNVCENETNNHSGSRADTSAVLSELAAAALRVFELLEAQGVLPLIFEYGPLTCSTTDFLSDLATIGIRADESSQRLKRGGRDRIPERRLQGETQPTVAPKVLCAITILMAWEATHGRRPGETNNKAHRACDAMWRALGFGQAQQWGNAPSGWRRELRAAFKMGPERNRQIWALMQLRPLPD